MTVRRFFLSFAWLLGLSLIVPSIAAANSSVLDVAELHLSSVGQDLNIEVVLADDVFSITNVSVVLESQAGEETLLDVAPNLNSFSQSLAPLTPFPGIYVVHLTFAYENEDGSAAGAEKIDEQVTIISESPLSQDNAPPPVSVPDVAPALPMSPAMPDTAMAPPSTPSSPLMAAVALIAFGLGVLSVAALGSRRR